MHPDGFHVHHKCCNSACVNRRHLVALSPDAHRAVHATKDEAIRERIYRGEWEQIKAAEAAEAARIEIERVEREQLERERYARIERERLEQERLEQERYARIEKERTDRERLERYREQNEQERRRRIEIERVEQEQRERDRILKERLAEEQRRLAEEERIEKKRLTEEQKRLAAEERWRREHPWSVLWIRFRYLLYGFGLCLLECLLVYLTLICKNVGGEISLYIGITEILIALVVVFAFGGCFRPAFKREVPVPEEKLQIRTSPTDDKPQS